MFVMFLDPNSVMFAIFSDVSSSFYSFDDVSAQFFYRRSRVVSFYRCGFSLWAWHLSPSDPAVPVSV